MPILPKDRVKPYPKDLTTVGNISEEYDINAEKKILLVNLIKLTKNIIIIISKHNPEYY